MNKPSSPSSAVSAALCFAPRASRFASSALRPRTLTAEKTPSNGKETVKLSSSINNLHRRSNDCFGSGFLKPGPHGPTGKSGQNSQFGPILLQCSRFTSSAFRRFSVSPDVLVVDVVLRRLRALRHINPIFLPSIFLPRNLRFPLRALHVAPCALRRAPRTSRFAAAAPQNFILGAQKCTAVFETVLDREKMGEFGKETVKFWTSINDLRRVAGGPGKVFSSGVRGRFSAGRSPPPWTSTSALLWLRLGRAVSIRGKNALRLYIRSRASPRIDRLRQFMQCRRQQQYAQDCR